MGVWVGSSFSNFVPDALYRTAIILPRKRANGLLQCVVAIRVLCPFLMKPLISLHSEIVKFPGYIHY